MNFGECQAFRGRLGKVPKKEHRRTKRGARDPLGPVCADRVRAILRLAEVSNRQAAAALRDRGVPVASQTLDYLTSDPPKQKRARRSQVVALASMGGVPVEWLTGEREALIQGSCRSAIEQITTYRWTNDLSRATLALLRETRTKPRNVARHGTVIMALTSPEHWRRWLLVNPPPLDLSEEGELAVHLAAAFRILLAPWVAGKARINPEALEGLAELWGLDAGSEITISDPRGSQ